MPPAGSLRVEGRAYTAQGGADPFPRVTIAIEDGIIRAVGAPRGGDLVLGDDERVLPGFLDLHAHCREDPSGAHTHKEDFTTAGAAALAGGIVGLADMPNNPLPPDTPSRYADKCAAARACRVDVLPYGLARAEAGPFAPDIPYKLYLDTVDSATPERIEAIFQRFAGHWMSVHAEDPDILKACAGAATHGARRPPEAEIRAVTNLLAALERAPCLHLHLCHLSVGACLPLVRAARNRGLPVSSEVCVHHLLFDERNFPAHLAAFSCVNPPLRTAADRKSLAAALADGTIDALATDHAPHLPAEKREGASGYPGLDVFGPLVTTLLDALEPARIAALTSGFAAAFWKRFAGETFGRIAPGAVGSLTVLGPTPWPGVRIAAPTSKCGWSPYVNMTFPGTVTATIVRGRTAYRRAPPA